MANTSKKELNRRDRAYYRRRQQNRVFANIVQLFAEEAEKGAISKKGLAEILGKDPSQITRWLSAPSNFELDTISDILLAMGAEMDHPIIRFVERSRPNYAHPLLVPYVEVAGQFAHQEMASGAMRVRPVTATSAPEARIVEVVS